jgi:ELWxxDGT repeat protein
VADVNPGPKSSLGLSDSFSSRSRVANVGKTVLFPADSGTEVELWKTDGTAEATLMVTDIKTGNRGSDPGQLEVWNGRVLFHTYESVPGLWASDGTPDGTISLAAGAWEIEAAGNVAFFVHNDWALWRTDGTPGGTVKLMHFGPGRPTYLTDVGGTLFFVAPTARGSELWKSDGTANGTTLVKIFTSQTLGPRSLVAFNGTLFFGAQGDVADGLELWKSDGTEAGTVMVRDLRPGLGSSNPTSLMQVGDTLYFSANGPAGTELWKSDGTADGTVVVKDINPGMDGSFPRGSSPYALTGVDGLLYFIANDGSGRGLWRSDGSADGTVLVKAGLDAYDPRFPMKPFFTTSRGTFFLGRMTGSDPQLWRTDGTTAGTVPVTTFIRGFPSWLIKVGETLFFSHGDALYGGELWLSDGTEAGTRRVSDIFPGSGSSGPEQLTDMGGTLVFTAHDPVRGRELWKVAPPLASVRTPRPVAAGGSVELDASATADPDPSETLTFAWDLDGDGAFGEAGADASRGDETGPRPAFSAAGLTAGQTVTVALRVTNSVGLFSTASAVLNVTAPPVVTAASLDPASAALGLNFTFDRDVAGQLSSQGLGVRDRASGAAVSVSDVSYDPATRTATFRLPAGLPDGDYRGTLTAKATAGGSGTAMAADYVFDFFILTGDMNRDRSVNGSDFAILAGNFGKSGKTYDKGDLTGDGSVNGSDFALLAGNFGRTLPAPPASAVAVAAPSTPATAQPSAERGAVKGRRHIRPQPRRRRAGERPPAP